MTDTPQRRTRRTPSVRRNASREEQSKSDTGRRLNIFGGQITANLKKLSSFLSKEPQKPRATIFHPVEYVDGVVQEFYTRMCAGDKLNSSEFDARKAWEDFIKPYKNRFPKPKTGGGRTVKDGDLTDVVQSFLDAAKSDGSMLTFDTLKEKVWSKWRPGKSIEAMQKNRTFNRDFRERVRRLEPDLPPTISTKRKVK
jgi:hypothetical protein